MNVVVARIKSIVTSVDFLLAVSCSSWTQQKFVNEHRFMKIIDDRVNID